MISTICTRAAITRIKTIVLINVIFRLARI